MLKKVIGILTVVAMFLAIGGLGIVRAQAGLDLKTLVITRTNELIKLAGDLKVDTSSLTAFQQSFNADQYDTAIKSLNSFPVVISVFAGLGMLKKLDEATLQAGLYRVVAALELFLEDVKKQETRVCVGLYLTTKKEERIVGPFVNDSPKEIGGTVSLKLQAQRCI